MHLYESHYAKLQFERAGLFKAIQDKYPARTVLYPGCSIHVTPSLYFPHVVYIDQSETSAQFFAKETSLLEFVSRNKRYKPSAYVRFLQQDYTQPLPLREGTFDLLLSLFAGGIALSCSKYLKPGGFLLTNNHRGDALDACNHPQLHLRAIVQFQKGRYILNEKPVLERHLPVQKRSHPSLRRAQQGWEYIENELYYVFERSR